MSDSSWDFAFGRRPARRLDGKVALITGAGSSGTGFGTGKAAALLFAREGASVVLFDRDEDSVRQTEQLIVSEGGKAVSVTGDVTSADEAEAAVDLACERFGGIDILDNNVGMVVRGDVTTATGEDWKAVLDVNLMGIVNFSRFAIPKLAERGGGSIINISSISPRRPYSATPYSVSKGAVDTLTRAMAIDHGHLGIRVNAIAPGPLLTPRAEMRQTPEQREQRKAASPLSLEGSGFDIGWAAVFLASDEARYITGTVLTVDGGVSVQGHRYR